MTWLDVVKDLLLRLGVLNLKLVRGIVSELLAVFTRAPDALTERVSSDAKVYDGCCYSVAVAPLNPIGGYSAETDGGWFNT